MPEQIWWTLHEFCTRLDLNERRTAKVLAYAPQRQRGKRTEFDFRLGTAMIYADLAGADYRAICPTCLQVRPDLYVKREGVDPGE